MLAQIQYYSVASVTISMPELKHLLNLVGVLPINVECTTQETEAAFGCVTHSYSNILLQKGLNNNSEDNINCLNVN